MLSHSPEMGHDHQAVSEGLSLVVGWSKAISPTCSVKFSSEWRRHRAWSWWVSRSRSISSTELLRSFPTFGQGVPTGPIGDSLVKEIAAVPSVVHPAVSVRVGPRQLSAHTNPHVPQTYPFRANVMHKRHLYGWCFECLYAPSGIFCHLLWQSKWSSLESADLSICRRDNWLPQPLRGGWPTGQNCSSASI